MAELILALDVADANAAEQILDQLPEVRWVKLGSTLMTASGPSIIARCIERELRVFLDLKWHDIPNTVAGAVTRARDLGVSLATVHCLGGARMLEQAALAAGPDLGLVGVTVLTSHDSASYGRTVGRTDVDLEAEVVRLAEEARWAGLAGIVCSPAEIAPVRGALGPRALIVVPGIRRSVDPEDDQKRHATAEAAVAAGATHLVVGRPILAAADPAEACGEFLRQAGGSAVGAGAAAAT